MIEQERVVETPKKSYRASERGDRSDVEKGKIHQNVRIEGEGKSSEVVRLFRTTQEPKPTHLPALQREEVRLHSPRSQLLLQVDVL